MADLFDYLQWRGDLTFSQDPPNPVDALIFSALAYIHFGGTVESTPDVPVSLADAADHFFLLPDQQERIRVKKDLSLLMAVAETRRFSSCKLLHYRDVLLPEEETQFAAVTFLLDDDTAFLAFRGTDYSLIGWKEDFNMSFQETIPAQRLALQYAQEVAAANTLPIRMGGHSKGGNLAVFAAVKADAPLRKRILGVYNNDGPGFREYLLRDPSYEEMVPRIHTFVPQSSVIGMLLEHEEPYTIIKSKQLGLLQHEFYSWVLEGPAFAPMEEITADSRFLNQTIKNWLAELTLEDRDKVIDAIFDLLSMENADSARDIIQPKNIRAYLRTLGSDSSIRNLLSNELSNFITAAKKTQQQLNQQESPPESA